MSVHTEWIDARSALVRYGTHEDAFGTKIEDKALVVGSDQAAVVIEGSRPELVELLKRALAAVRTVTASDPEPCVDCLAADIRLGDIIRAERVPGDVGLDGTVVGRRPQGEGVELWVDDKRDAGEAILRRRRFYADDQLQRAKRHDTEGD